MTELDQFSVGEILLRDNSQLVCERVVRYVPGRRVVCKAIWQQRQVYAKIFIGAHAERHIAREKSGWQMLTQAGLLTPELLLEMTLADGGGHVLLYAAIEVAGSAEDNWRGLAGDSQGRLHLMRMLTRAIASHHQAGVMQTDLYLKNFLVESESVYTLDCDGIRQLGRFCVHRRSLRNLATLFSKMDVTDDVWIPELYREYCQQRGWLQWELESKALQELTSRIRIKTASDYADRKVFRTCSDVVVEQSPERFLAIAKGWGELLEPGLNEPDTWLDEESNHRLKSGNTCTLSLVEFSNKRVVVKRYNIKNFWHGLNRALRSSRAAACWANAHRLKMYDIAAAAPVALLERRCGPFRRQAYFLAEFIDAPDVIEFFADANLPAARKISAAHCIASLFHKLYLLKLEHGDFKATNMKMPNDKPLLLDLDSMRQRSCHWFFVRRHIRDLRRFMRNWQQDPATRDLLSVALKNAYKDTGLLKRAGIM
ncbi:MAG TPA: lipopolysaccharide kinase InaA family protein [Methylophilaceae bacterium]|jgi:hypothetical protein